MLRLLEEKDYTAVMDLFAACFRDDHYFHELYGNSADFESRLRESSKYSIKYCIDSGMSYGVFDVDRLVGFMLCFNYKWTQVFDRPAFRSIFLGSCPEIHLNVAQIDGPVLYLMLVGVDLNHRRKGVASRLLDAVIAAYPDYTIVSDVSALESVAMYQKRGFSVSPLEPDYVWVQSQK